MSVEDAGVPDRMTVFQRAVSSFNQSTLPAEEARSLLTQLVHLFYVGDAFGEAEATQLFFTITKLFQKENAGLKQMIYLAIKELVPFTDNVIMGTSVLMRDVQQAQQSPRSRLYRPQALRALCRILDASAVEGMDRLMRSSIVDADEAMASAAVVSAYHLVAIAPEAVSRWVAETQEVLGSVSPGSILQYHALGLLLALRGDDSMAALKLVLTLASSGSLRNENAAVLHIRRIGALWASLDSPDLERLLQGYLTSRSDIVSLEAAKTALNIGRSPELAAAAINVLRAFLGSPRATSRFAAIRTLNRYAAVDPEAVATCNAEIEALVTDSSQSIATFAITALLKTGSASSVDSLIDQISRFMGDISDDFRLVVVDAIRNLAKRFPDRHDRMLEFFADSLRQDGGRPLKLAIVQAISDILLSESAAESLNSALLMLCETIEDSEYPEVTIRVLHLLGTAGPTSSDPSALVRFIYNRVILENSVVRAAAVSALGKFISVVPSVRPLVERSLRDVNDEVRDRAALALSGVVELPPMKFAVADLEQQLLAYLADPTQQQDAFDSSRVTRVSDSERLQRRIAAEVATVEDEPAPSPEAALAAAAGAADDAELVATTLAQIPEIAALGNAPLHSGRPLELTGRGMELGVTARVHVYENHIVVGFEVHNDLAMDIHNLTVQADIEELDNEVAKAFVVKVPILPKEGRDTVYLGLERVPDEMTLGTVPTRLQFVVDDDEEEYAIDDLELRPSDFIVPQPVADFDAAWNELTAEEVATRQLKSKSLQKAVDFLETHFGLLAAAGTGVVPDDVTTHAVKLYGKALSGVPIALQARLVRSSRTGVAGKIFLRSTDEDVSTAVIDSL